MEEKKINGRTLRIMVGDITEKDTDAIVNAANNYLKHGGGVAGAIVRKGGKIIQEESDRIGFVPTGSAAITSAGSLKAKYVIHAVGPKWGEGDEEKKLKNAVLSSLKLANDYKLKSISFPAISSGIYGCPKNMVAKVLIKTAVEYLKSTETTVEVIEFCLFDEETYRYFKEEFDKI
ncbi:O-acetyl-ADP-ribose deacetylase [Thermodesulfovibrio aggregans]|uniref:O-acetyl-ADP-ribose deacetylase n=1 Tax=Thermodesulfovibrio aggregans TaxID=86166 RepID=A0A0U9HTI2_9BACT|nr:macro domain-containing protein [Thermodesulfovibrio aggregans]GAQ95098.1 O-acetyl-ADP-ribose deacetylase [Thermodesulfovibrio aggregans]